MEAQDYIYRMIKLSGEKILSLEEILQTYLLQLEDLKARNFESTGLEGSDLDISAAIYRRQSLMEEIDARDADFNEVSEELKASLGISTLEALSLYKLKGLQTLKDNVKRITDLLEVLADLHNRAEALLKEKMNELAFQMRQLGKSKQVNSAYRSKGSAPSSSVYFDKKK